MEKGRQALLQPFHGCTMRDLTFGLGTLFPGNRLDSDCNLQPKLPHTIVSGYKQIASCCHVIVSATSNFPSHRKPVLFTLYLKTAYEYQPNISNTDHHLQSTTWLARIPNSDSCPSPVTAKSPDLKFPTSPHLHRPRQTALSLFDLLE